MSKFYSLAYAIGFTPWETANQAPAEVERFVGLIAREEDERGGPGKALDVGCGSGFWVLALAKRGWQVTGVDLAGKALARARARIADAGVSATIVRADATELPADTVGTGFDLFLDAGCYHGLKPDQRTAMARAVTARANPGACLHMFAFGKALGPKFMPQGATRADIEAAYADWDVIEVAKLTGSEGVPKIGQKADPTLYRLRRRA